MKQSPRVSSPSRIMALDVAPATRAVYIQMPPEDRLPGDEGFVPKLNFSFYGTRDVAKNWAQTYTALLNRVGFETGKGSTCNFCHQTKQIAMTVHGDDFTACGSDQDLAWLSAKFKEKFKVKVQVLGPGPEHRQEVRILNRIVRWIESVSNTNPIRNMRRWWSETLALSKPRRWRHRAPKRSRPWQASLRWA